MTDWLRNLPSRSATYQAILLGMVVIAVLLIVAPVALCTGGQAGLRAAALAAILCLTGAVVALMAGRLLRGPSRALVALFAGMAARMGIPLTFGLAIYLQGGPLAEAGLVYYLVVFYPVTLAAETMLSLPLSEQDLGNCRHVTDDSSHER